MILVCCGQFKRQPRLLPGIIISFIRRRECRNVDDNIAEKGKYFANWNSTEFKVAFGGIRRLSRENISHFIKRIFLDFLGKIDSEFCSFGYFD